LSSARVVPQRPLVALGRRSRLRARGESEFK